MSRYIYNESLVTQALEQLASASKSLDQTNVEIEKGISMINSARGSENILADFSYIKGYQSQVIEYVEEISGQITEKAQEIEEFENAPWYKKLFSTLGLSALKIVEGIASFGENLMDGVVSVVGFTGGLFSSEFKDCVGEFVKKDYVGDAFYKAYEGDGALGWLNKNSYYSHTSTAANVLKGIGTATGYIAVGIATGGAGFAGLAASAGVGLVGGIGNGTQSGLQQGMSFNQAFGKGFKEGAVAAGTTLVVGGIANKLSKVSSVSNAAKGGKIVNNKLATSLQKVGGKVASTKVGKQATNIVNKVSQSTVGKGVSNVITNFGSKGIGKQAANLLGKMGPAGVGGVSAAAGQKFGLNPIVDSIETTQFKINAEPSVAQQLVEESNLLPLEQVAGNDSLLSTPTIAPIEQIEQPVTTGGGGNNSVVSVGGGGGGGTTQHRIDSIQVPNSSQLPSHSTGTPTIIGGSETSTHIPEIPKQQQTPINQNPITNNLIAKDPSISSSNPTNSTPHISKTTTGNNQLAELSQPTIKSETIMNSLGNSASSLDGLTTETTYIPTSTKPILSSQTIKTKSSAIPITAGLGAAAAAGIGAKAVLDKKSKKDEEESTDPIETEEWQEDATSMDIDIGDETSEEADYLTPNDEYAFQEN